MNPQIPAHTMAKLNDTYYLNIGYSNYFSKERIYKVNSKGTVISKYHPIETKLFTVSEPNFSLTGSSVIFHESFCNAIYDVTSETVKPRYTIDFGKYSISDEIHKMEPMQVLPELNSKGMCLITGFFENKDFVYIAVHKQQMRETECYHLLIDKKTGNKRVISVSEDDNILDSFGRVDMLTDNNELVFLVHQAPLIDLVKMNPFFKGDLLNPLDEELNPFIAKVKLKSF
jgi:hypothetical protein